jgi:cell fate regulator YaaT (PSP1 superfamily)
MSYQPKGSCCKLNVYNWLRDIPEDRLYRIFEVRFKNTHKDFFYNVNNLPLENGDIVAVESPTGHDIGIISACGPVVPMQMKRQNETLALSEMRKIYRKAKPVDIEKWQTAIAREQTVMIKSRQIAVQLNLNMKIGDVEFQGDGTKATFYYIADDRVDFRELIKILAGEFRIRVEMKQIGARQEAGLIGGIGVCGRELCCTQWIADFISVNTSSARIQELSLNPQKLAGQCSKLKCCLNYELDTYIEASKDTPEVKTPLDTAEGLAYLQKNDVLRGVMWFSFDPYNPITQIPVPIVRVKEILDMNSRGEKPEYLLDDDDLPEPSDFISAVGEGSITRFDPSRRRSRSSRRRRPARSAAPAAAPPESAPASRPDPQNSRRTRSRRRNNNEQRNNNNEQKNNNNKQNNNNA